MKGQPHTAAILAAVLLSPLGLRATPQVSGEITSKNIRRAETEAKSAADHLRIAEYYQNQAKSLESQLVVAQKEVDRWGASPAQVHYSKTPDSYWNARSRVATIQNKLDKVNQRFTEQKKLAESAH